MDQTPSLQATPVKKSPFDDLNRDELVNKCKGLLSIAQKAKQLKTELQNEVETYKLLLEKSEFEKKQSQESFKTLQELVDSLTEQKLNIITEVDSAQSKVKALNRQCQNYEAEINNYKADLILKDQSISDITQKLSDLDSEVISLKRQNKRLVEENEQLITQLTEIETRTTEFNNIGLQQREQLKILEQNVKSDKELNIEIDELNKIIKELEHKLDSTQKENIKQIEEMQLKIDNLGQLYESEKTKKDKATVKLRSYKDKILKCAACINQLKNSRFILTKTVKEYSENIPKWQDDIINASKVLDGQINKLNSENYNLKEKLKMLEEHEEKRASQDNVQMLNNQAVALNDENKFLQNQVTQLREQLNEALNKSTFYEQEINKLQLIIKNLKEIELPSQENENKLLQEQINENNKKIYSLSQQNVEIKKTLESFKSENKKLQSSLQIKLPDNNVIESLNLQIKALESEKDTLVNEKLNAKDSVIELENKNKILTEQLNKSASDLMNMKAEYDRLAQEKVLLENKHKIVKESEINVLKCKIMSLQEQLELLKKEYDNTQDLNNLLKEEVDTLKLSLEQPNDDSENVSDLNASLQADIVKLETKLAAYKQENGSLLAEVKESRAKLKGFDALLVEFEDAKSKLSNYKAENGELLHEMKEINQVLKERGETISKQQKAIAEMERLIETLEQERDSTNDEKVHLHQKIEYLETELKSAEKNTTANFETIEVINTERDNVNKQLAEYEGIIFSLKEEIEKLKQNSSSAELPNEDMSTSTISRAEDYSRMKDLDETFEEKYTKLRIFALKLKKKLNETASQLQNTEQDKAKLEKLLSEAGQPENKNATCEATDECDSESKNNDNTEILELKAKIKSITESSENVAAELEKVKAELTTKTKDLAAEIDAHKKTKDSLEKARRDIKKKSVLSLEMEDYERSLKELTTKMEEKKKKMVQMESTIDTQEGTITAMKTQIKLLEEQVKSEETQNRLTREELQQAIDESKDKENLIQAKNVIITKLEQDLEDEKRKNEEYDLEMTSLISEKEKIIIGLGEEKAELNNKAKRLEFKCSELNEKLKITNMELADLKTEYSSYKVRAQAVLRQNQTVDHSQEEQLKEEAAALKAQLETLTLKLTTAQEQCTEQKTEVENARWRAAEAAIETARAHQRNARLHADLTRLSQLLDSERTQHKLQVSTLTQCYKTQISDLELKLQKETETLMKQLAVAQDTSSTRKAVVPLEDGNDNQYVLPVIPKDDSDGEMDINVTMIPREEGEGSESAPSPPPSKPYGTSAGSGRSPLPLERLLEEGVPEDESLDTSSLGLTPDQEIADLKQKLQAQQQRVRHVTVLLSESERECARMAQLSELLKAELRRVRGTTNNAHNTEYMKNVTLKFLTLPPGDERSRLVPVLQKILTLSPDETQKINAVAKGLDPNPGKGWGSYLPWPGGSKG